MVRNQSLGYYSIKRGIIPSMKLKQKIMTIKTKQNEEMYKLIKIQKEWYFDLEAEANRQNISITNLVEKSLSDYFFASKRIVTKYH